MSGGISFLSSAYRCLLRLYPASFRAEFAAEMEDVFRQAIQEATMGEASDVAAASRGQGALVRLCLRELRDWPAALGREWAASLRAGVRPGQEGGIMEDRPSMHGAAPAPWGEALLGAAALLVPGLALALAELPTLHPWWPAFYFGAYLFILLGLLAGWVRGFPRWSYPYVGYGLVWPLWLSSVSTPGLRLLGYAFSRHQPWGWRAWLGLGAVAILALLLTRSLRPLARLFTGAWRDWTRLSFALYGGLPLALWGLFDEVHRPHPVPYLILASLCLAAGALAYMRSGTDAGRLLSLLAGLTSSWLVSTVGLATYWHGRLVGRGDYPLDWWSDTARPMAYGWVVVALILLLPLLLGLLRRAVRPRHAA